MTSALFLHQYIMIAWLEQFGDAPCSSFLLHFIYSLGFLRLRACALLSHASQQASSAEVPVLVPVAEMDEKPAMGSAASLSKNERPRLPDKFYKLLTKPRLKAIKQVFLQNHSTELQFVCLF